MSSIKIITAAAALLIGASQLAMAQSNSGAPAAQSQSSAVNGQQSGTGPNAKSYGTKQNMGREQPEQKSDMGSGAGK